MLGCETFPGSRGLVICSRRQAGCGCMSSAGHIRMYTSRLVAVVFSPCDPATGHAHGPERKDAPGTRSGTTASAMPQVRGPRLLERNPWTVTRRQEVSAMNSKTMPVVFSPDNEPYLGRNLLYQFDQLICSAMEQNAVTAPMSHGQALSDHQRMACQVIPQALSITLSIRELVRQGYLFGAHVLVRAFVERAAILLYLHLYPEDIARWNRGWHQKDAPSLAKMFEAIQARWQHDPAVRGRDLTASMNSLMHAKPDSAPWNLVSLGENVVGHAVSKILNRPELCDDLCANVIPCVLIVQGMMAAYFPNEPAT